METVKALKRKSKQDEAPRESPAGVQGRKPSLLNMVSELKERN
jgi:hypothetical protein